MCGRYPSTRAAPLIDAIEAALVDDATVAGVLAMAPGMPAGLTSWWAPRWNVAPTQPVRAVVLIEGAPRLTLARWGVLAPPRGPSLAPVINARAETLATSRLFGKTLATARCLVVADGFYEWRDVGAGRAPVRIAPDEDGPAITLGAVARLARRDGVEVTELAIITTAASALVAPIHERQPAVIEPADRARWLDPGAPLDGLADLLAPSTLAGWTATAAPRWLNSSRVEHGAAAD
ncbi:MAG: SOS response-associated peptidase [Myxococcales bacterium]|nr:SOS response-associated peptidase [Myxococcales bacterium]